MERVSPFLHRSFRSTRSNPLVCTLGNKFTNTQVTNGMLNIVEIPKLRYWKNHRFRALHYGTAKGTASVMMKEVRYICKSNRDRIPKRVHLSSVSPVIHLNKLNPPDSLLSLVLDCSDTSSLNRCI